MTVSSVDRKERHVNLVAGTPTINLQSSSHKRNLNQYHIVLIAYAIHKNDAIETGSTEYNDNTKCQTSPASLAIL